MNTLCTSLNLYLSTFPELNFGYCGLVTAYVGNHLKRLNIPFTICFSGASLCNRKDYILDLDEESEIYPYMDRAGIFIVASHVWISTYTNYINQNGFVSDFKVENPILIDWVLKNLSKSNLKCRRYLYWNGGYVDRRELYHGIHRIFNCFK